MALEDDNNVPMCQSGHHFNGRTLEINCNLHQPQNCTSRVHTRWRTQPKLKKTPIWLARSCFERGERNEMYSEHTDWSHRTDQISTFSWRPSMSHKKWEKQRQTESVVTLPNHYITLHWQTFLGAHGEVLTILIQVKQRNLIELNNETKSRQALDKNK
jgi:hypothetical protein